MEGRETEEVMKTERENIRYEARGKSRRRRLIPAVVAAVRRDWTGLSIALLWACNVAMALKFTALEEELQEQREKAEGSQPIVGTK